jgi:hypothetical protein
MSNLLNLAIGDFWIYATGALGVGLLAVIVMRTGSILDDPFIEFFGLLIGLTMLWLVVNGKNNGTIRVGGSPRKK